MVAMIKPHKKIISKVATFIGIKEIILTFSICWREDFKRRKEVHTEYSGE